MVNGKSISHALVDFSLVIIRDKVYAVQSALINSSKICFTPFSVYNLITFNMFCLKVSIK